MVVEAAQFLAGRDHPLRRALTEEMHLRRFPCFAAPARVLQIVVVTTDLAVDGTRAHAESLCEHFHLPAPSPGKYFSARLPGLDFVWEQHSEFSTYSLIKSGTCAEPFSGSLLSDVPRDWLEALPGQVLRATQIVLLSATDPEPTLDGLREYFDLDELVCCDVQSCEARIWSNFKLHDDGLGRLLIRDQALVGTSDPARLLQRLQELGNYRNMALLGLPLVQKLNPALSALERRLALLTREISSGAAPDDQLLQQLTTLSADLARLNAETSYRMSATKAYAQLVADRLAGVQVQRVRGFQTLADFTERRLTPAVRTCESFSRRLDDLAQRASWASSLLRTRIETALEHQTRDLLQAMNRRAQVQLRLQQTVEGLSVIAISYYAVGIVSYVTKSLNHFVPTIDPGTMVGFAAPIIVLCTWWLLRRLHRRLAQTADPPAGAASAGP